MALTSWKLATTNPAQGAPDLGTEHSVWPGNTTTTVVDATGSPARDLDIINGPLTTRERGWPALDLYALNGTTQYVQGTGGSAGDDTAAIQAGDFLVGGWFEVDAFGGSAQTLVAVDGISGVAANDRCQFSIRVSTQGAVFTRWNTAGGNVDVSSSTGAVVAGQVAHIAALVEVDPEHFYKRRVTIFVDGEPVVREGDLDPPTGGSAARWHIGAQGLGGAPGEFLDGAFADVFVYFRRATGELVRHIRARALKDWLISPSVVDVPFFEVHTRVLVQDRLGALRDTFERYRRADGFVDMNQLGGWDWVVEASIDENIDNQVQSASVTFLSRIGEASLSPYMVPLVEVETTAPFDDVVIYGNPLNWNDTFLADMNEVKIEVAVVPYGTGREGAAPFYSLRFHGHIGRVDAGTERTRVQLADRMKPLQDVWIEPAPDGQDWEYGSEPVGTPVEEIMQAIIDDNDPRRYEVLLVDDTGPGGTLDVDVLDLSQAPEPGKPHLFQAGDTFAIENNALGYDGVYTVDTATAERLTTVEVHAGPPSLSGEVYGLESDHGYIGRKPTLYVESSPGWDVYPFAVPASQNVATALEDLPAHIGYACRYAWDDDWQEWRLSLSRFQNLDDFRVSLFFVLDVPSQRADAENERNVIVSEYGEVTDPDNTDQDRRRIVVATSPATRYRFSRRYARVGIASYDLVNTSSEAQSFTDRMADDLDNPEAETVTEMLYSPRVVLGASMRVYGENKNGPTAFGFENGCYVDILPRAFSRGGSALQQKFGIVAIRSTFSMAGAKQAVTTRREVAPTRTIKHRDVVQQRGFTKTLGTLSPKTSGITATATAVAVGALRGFQARWTHPTPVLGGAAWDFTEVHTSTSSGFTPSSSTLRGTQRGTSFLELGLAAATTYYVKIVLRDRMRNESVTVSAGSITTAA